MKIEREKKCNLYFWRSLRGNGLLKENPEVSRQKKIKIKIKIIKKKNEGWRSFQRMNKFEMKIKREEGTSLELKQTILVLRGKTLRKMEGTSIERNR